MKIVIGNYPSPTDSRNLILNDIVKTSDTTETFAIISKVEGLETAPYRNGTGDWSGADGGYLSSHLFSARTITISGAYIDRQAGCDFSAETSTQFDHLARLYIRSRLPIRKKLLVRIFLDSGMTFCTEGYCTDIKMDLTAIGSGDYQIVMYCPDPALYRCDKDGAIGSEWNMATVRKQNSTGYISSEMTEGGVKYAFMTNDSGIVWKTGGRSTPVQYSGDFPYYPQFVVSSPNKYITNPIFYSLNEKKFFGLGYPATDVAMYRVTGVGPNGEIITVDALDTGSYDADYSGNGIIMRSYSYADVVGRSEYGAGATFNFTATKTENDLWTFTVASVKDPGENYEVGDIITPHIAGAAILQISPNQELKIDMAEHTATLNGESVAYYITPGSEWFQLDPLTANNIIFASAEETDADYAKIRWRNGYLGI